MRTKISVGVCDELAAELQKRVANATHDFFQELPAGTIDPEGESLRTHWIMEHILIEDYFMDMLFGNLPEDPEYYEDIRALREIVTKYYDLSDFLERGKVEAFSIDGKGRYFVQEVM